MPIRKNYLKSEHKCAIHLFQLFHTLLCLLISTLSVSQFSYVLNRSLQNSALVPSLVPKMSALFVSSFI